MKRSIIIIILTIAFTSVYGQYSLNATSPYVENALLYSQTFPSLTARSLGMGGAFTSLGGDFSSSYLNPAGLGLYRKSEFTFSPGLGYNSTKSNYYNESNQDFKYQFILGNLGYVGNYNSGKDNGLVSASYALGYNRLNNFNSRAYIRGENQNNSLTDYFMQNANGIDPNNLDAFYERLAFDAYIIDTIPGGNNEYQTPVFYPLDQRKTIETTGGTGEWTFGMGFNFSNVFYFGFGLGVDQLRYQQTTVLSEYDNNNLSDFNNFHFTEDLDVWGTGFNFKMGAMVRVLKFMRIGASIHLPTYYKIREDYYNTMTSTFDNGDNYYVEPTDINGYPLSTGTFKYRLNTPMRVMTGLSLQIGEAGLITADAEYVDYSSMRLRQADNETDFTNDNSSIENIYRSVINLKVGGELRFDNISFRLGGGYYPSPYAKDELNANASYSQVTAGIGYRDNDFFVDLGFAGTFHSDKYNLYTVQGLPDQNNIANLNQFGYQLIATFGFRF